MLKMMKLLQIVDFTMGKNKHRDQCLDGYTHPLPLMRPATALEHIFYMTNDLLTLRVSRVKLHSRY
jgi:hypothetical protein